MKPPALRITRLVLLALGELAVATALTCAADDSAAVPAGWHVDLAPPDPGLSDLPAEKLVDCLLVETGGKAGAGSPAHPEGFLPLEAPTDPSSKEPITHQPPVMTEIVRRGVGIIPTLLDHLSDARPTRVLLDPRERHLNGMSGPYTDVYDCRFHENGPQPSGVNSQPEKSPAKGQWPYTVKAGDLCFVALGQIVNRRLYLAGPDFGNGQMFDGMFVLSINSPVESPGLALAARADWGGISAAQFAAGLRNDALGINDPQPKLIDGVWHPAIDRIGAVNRLLVYFPGIGREVVESLLRRPLVHWALPSTSRGPGQQQATDSEETSLVAALRPFRWNGLDAEIFALYQRAADEEEKVIAARPPAERLAGVGYDLPLACARRLIHQGHDGEFRAFFTAAVVRANNEYPSVMEKLKNDILKEPSRLSVLPASQAVEIERLQKEARIQGLLTMLRDPIAARVAFLQELDANPR